MNSSHFFFTSPHLSFSSTGRHSRKWRPPGTFLWLPPIPTTTLMERLCQKPPVHLSPRRSDPNPEAFLLSFWVLTLPSSFKSLPLRIWYPLHAEIISLILMSPLFLPNFHTGWPLSPKESFVVEVLFCCCCFKCFSASSSMWVLFFI